MQFQLYDVKILGHVQMPFSYTTTVYHDVENDANAPDVVSMTRIWYPLQDLRCCICRAATERLANIISIHNPRETKV